MATASIGSGWEGGVVDGAFPLLEWLEGSGNRASFLTLLQGSQEAVIQLISAAGAEADTYVAQWDFVKTLPHPHLLRILASGKCAVNGRELAYVVTERSHATLAKIIQQRAMSADSAREMFALVLSALRFLHENQVVHGHVNPSNILLADATPKLSATDLLVAGSATRPVSEPGSYDAPELSSTVPTSAADAWSVGVILWESMTQSLPAWDSSGTEEPENIAALPQAFREIVVECLRRDPLRRPTIQNILERLDANATAPHISPATLFDNPAPAEPDTPIPAQAENPAPAHIENPPPAIAAAPVSVNIDSPPAELTPPPTPAPISEPEPPAPEVLPHAPAPAPPRLFADEPASVSSREHTVIEPSSSSISFSRALRSFEEPPASRSLVMPFALVILAAIAVGAFLLYHQHVTGRGITEPAVNAPPITQQTPAQPPSQTPTQPTGQSPTEESPVPSSPVPSQIPPAAATSPAPASPAPGQSASGTSPASQPQAPAPDQKAAQKSQTATAAAPNQPEPKPPAPQERAPHGDAKGLVAKRVLPAVSPGASREMRRPIEVVLRVSVNSKGKVSDVTYVSLGPGNYFARISQRAARSWQFTPPTRNGNPEPSVWTLRFNFDRARTDATATETSE